MDDVDNSAAQPRPEPPLTGPDLARAALEAAKEAAKARGRMPAPWRKGAGTGGARGQGQDYGQADGQPSGRRHGGRARRRAWSGPRPDDRDPQPLGRLAARLAADRGWREQLSDGAVFGRWAELVGADVAEHATPVSLRDGELTVQAVSTAWATQLRLLQRDLLAKITAGAGRGVVTRLRIHGPTAPSWRHGSRHVPGRGPRDTYG